jgi:aldose 1-epimerase
MQVERFGSFEGVDILEITLGSADGLEARVITWGAVLRDLVVPHAGGRRRVVLGLKSVEDYAAHSPYFGAIVGRYANRIAGARFALGGRTHELKPNENGNQLHGGPRGFGQRPWTLMDASRDGATLGLVSEDGDQGYPGRLVATCTYAIQEPGTLRIEIQATCDRATPVNLTTHSYYNLDGSPDILGHHLQIEGDFITPTTPDLIPTGEVKAVAETPFDFRASRAIGASPPLLRRRTLYDVNYVLRAPGGLAHAATLTSRANGLAMELWTTEPGLQFYDGHLLDMPVPGLDGVPYARHGGLCLEPQRFPDGPNRRHFPPCILAPGEVSRQASELRFRPA